MAFLKIHRPAAANRLYGAAAAAAFVWITTLAFPAPTPSVSEHQIKAAALYNIISFTEWPASAFETASSPLVIGVLGQEPIASLLGEFIANEKWHGRQLILRPLASPADARGCHVVYIARGEHARWRAMSPQLAIRPILTAGDDENFARFGGMVQFAMDRNKLRLIVNLRNARAARLTISSKVLRLAKVIDDEKS